MSRASTQRGLAEQPPRREHATYEAQLGRSDQPGQSAQVPRCYQLHLQGATTPDASLLQQVWEPDGVLNFPYAPVGGVRRLEGVEAICAYFTDLPIFGDFTFRGVQGWSLGEDGWLVELHGSSTLLATGRPYEQDYVVRFGLSERGLISWMREYWDAGRMG